MFLKIAWRNLWRNKRRTMITLASIFFAVVLSSLMMSMKEGTYKNMINSMVGAHLGYVQIQDSSYAEEANIDDLMSYNSEIIDFLKSESKINAFAPRIESFALAASDEVTKGVMVVGGDPEIEKSMNQLDERISDGEYLSPGEKGTMIGAGLSEYLNLGVGDTIVLISQGYHGVSSAGKYPIKGLIKYGSPELSKQIVFLPLEMAQEFYGAEGMLTSISLDIQNKKHANVFAKQLNRRLMPGFRARSWEEITPELKNMIETDRVEGYVFMFILYMVISFGILGTLIMMIAERRKEFGILVGIGMRKWRLAITFLMEIIILSIIGALVGILGAFPVCAYFYANPIRFGEGMAEMIEEYGMEAILQTSLDPIIYIQQAIIVFVISLVVTMYPFFKISQLNVMNYLRS
jgi:ABC-type lipoprotein release transport system permease subunit